MKLLPASKSLLSRGQSGNGINYTGWCPWRELEYDPRARTGLEICPHSPCTHASLVVINNPLPQSSSEPSGNTSPILVQRSGPKMGREEGEIRENSLGRTPRVSPFNPLLAQMGNLSEGNPPRCWPMENQDLHLTVHVSGEGLLSCKSLDQHSGKNGPISAAHPHLTDGSMHPAILAWHPSCPLPPLHAHLTAMLSGILSQTIQEGPHGSLLPLAIAFDTTVPSGVFLHHMALMVPAAYRIEYSACLDLAPDTLPSLFPFPAIRSPCSGTHNSWASSRRSPSHPSWLLQIPPSLQDLLPIQPSLGRSCEQLGPSTESHHPGTTVTALPLLPFLEHLLITLQV